MAERKKKRNALIDKFIDFDRFGERIEFEIKQSNRFKTPVGTILTFLVFVFMVLYGAQKLETMIGRGSTNYTTFMKESGIPDTEVFKQESTNFYVAFSFLGQDVE